jgi:hypothetical protein
MKSYSRDQTSCLYHGQALAMGQLTQTYRHSTARFICIVFEMAIDIAMRTEIQQFFGSDATAGGIRFQFSARIKEDVSLLKQARIDGIDCKDVVLSAKARGQKFAFFYFLSTFSS